MLPKSVDEPAGPVATGKPPHLTMFPALRARIGAAGEITITKKFLEGINEYLRLWPGRMRVLVQETPQVTDNLDNITVRPEDLPFELRVIGPPDQIDLAEHLRDTSLVLASLDDFRQNKVSQVCRAAGIPCIYTSEYSLTTRLQQAAVNFPNLLRRWRSYLWLWNQERQRRRAARLASAVQCNGTPTYDAYQGINPNRLLYFDTRVSSTQLATAEEVERRCAPLLAGQPLRLLFSGRLARIKGADHLLDVAVALRQLQVPFQMFICGGGELDQVLRTRIGAEGLADCVTMKGVLAFDTELVPFVKDNADLFVCCHRQGDPSCTYLETMACGVPIVGYANEAMTGFVHRFGLGWMVPINRPKLLANQIAQLHHDRQAVRAMALKSLAFAREHSFEKTFATRMDLIFRVLRQSTPV